MQNGAFDFFEKPFSDNKLVDRTITALEKAFDAVGRFQSRKDLEQRLNELTSRELEVMWLIAEGLPNKLIADRLDISIRTIEIHRSRIYRKINVTSGIDLTNVLAANSVKRIHSTV